MKLASFQLQEEKKQIRMDESREDDALGKKKIEISKILYVGIGSSGQQAPDLLDFQKILGGSAGAGSSMPCRSPPCTCTTKQLNPSAAKSLLPLPQISPLS